MSKGVVVHESTLDAVIEQLGYWKDAISTEYAEDINYLKELVSELEEAKKTTVYTFTKEEYQQLEKHFDLEAFFGE